jgi:trans-aconitate methyltransferase
VNKQNFTLNFGISKFFDLIVYAHRSKMFNYLFTNSTNNFYSSILDIGSTSDVSTSSNAFLNFFDAPKIISVSDQEITKATRNKFPHVDFIYGDGLNLSIESSSFDLVFSNAVLEHVGGVKNVSKFIHEAVRVARKEVILITPNRWFPLETHTKLFFVHWLPQRFFRRLLKKIGMDFFAQEENLNLLSVNMLKKLVAELNIAKYEFKYIKFLGMPSNIVLKIYK